MQMASRIILKCAVNEKKKNNFAEGILGKTFTFRVGG
jgi:hypothetical protein